MRLYFGSYNRWGIVGNLLVAANFGCPRISLALILAFALTFPAARSAIAQSEFSVRNTGDLVRLCSVQQSDPMYAAASKFCEGFMVGVFRVLEKRERVGAKKKMAFCRRAKAPSRDEVIAAFVEWAKADRRRLTLTASSSVSSFLSLRYPCPLGI